MRKQIIAGNWKMNMTMKGAEALCSLILKNGQHKGREVVLVAPFIHLESLIRQTKGSQIKVAAQNCHEQLSGAYTGEISALMLSDMGLDYVLLGHSERRAHFNETSALLASKVNSALLQGLKVIFCCGETSEQRNSGKYLDIVSQQISEALFHLNPFNFKNIVLAYEPVWAIGTGKTASSTQAQEMHYYLRNFLAKKFGKVLADNMSILYGGSCNSSNASELFSQPDIDGGLIGGASLLADDFISIIKY
jgi:triosephosphate isomerase